MAKKKAAKKATKKKATKKAGARKKKQIIRSNKSWSEFENPR